MTTPPRQRRTASASPPPQEGRLIRLVILEPRHYDALYTISTSAETGFRWRHRGTTPSPERFVQSLWDGVLAQFVVERRDTGAVVGLVVAYDANPRHRYVSLALAATAEEIGHGRMMEAGALFVNWLFTMWDYHKIYAESIEFNYQSFASGAGKLFQIEGRLKEHEFYGGRRWDLLQLAIYRRDWMRTPQGLDLSLRDQLP